MGLFTRISKPTKGLFPIEKIVLLYLFFTLILMFIMRGELPNFDEMLLMRVRILVCVAVAWGLYRLAPCDATVLLRVFIHIFSLVEWYPDTYEFNRCFPNLDHIFCAWEGSLFGCQPSLLFSQVVQSKVVTELLDLGYASYYPLIVLTAFFIYLYRKDLFQRVVFVIMGAFLLYYVVFIFLPVAGPTFYFRAVGVDLINEGVYPSLGDYFFTHNSLSLDCLPTPGWQDGLMWKVVEIAKQTGERPTAAFPSSHVGVIVVCLLLLWRAKSKKALCFVAFFAVLMFFATVYIQAHYAIDALAGLVSGVLIFFLLWYIYPLFESE